jgi:hypothetical protein
VSKYRLGQFVNGSWVEYSHPPVFEQPTGTEPARLAVGVPNGDADVLRTLAGCTEPPYHLLYVLVVPRGEGNPGRYQSPLLEREETVAFLERYADFFRADGRAHLWLYSPSSKATLVWDRHNILYAYGPLPCFEEKLRALGFHPGTVGIPAPHEHHYRQVCDADAASILGRYEWRYSELRPEDSN